MLPQGKNIISLIVSRSPKFLLYRVKGVTEHPMRFDLINLDGKKVRSTELIAGREFVIPIAGLKKGEYLFALSSAQGLLKTGVIQI